MKAAQAKKEAGEAHPSPSWRAGKSPGHTALETRLAAKWRKGERS